MGRGTDVSCHYQLPPLSLGKHVATAQVKDRYGVPERQNDLGSEFEVICRGTLVFINTLAHYDPCNLT